MVATTAGFPQGAVIAVNVGLANAVLPPWVRMGRYAAVPVCQL